MNKSSQPTPPALDPSSGAGDRARGVDPSRRRLVRSGLAGSVVLGTLVSKPVLGAEYICTVSGHTSGNMSAPGRGDVNCRIGSSPAQWLTSTVWPAPFMKGALPTPPNTANNECTFPAIGPGTRFNGYAAGGKILVAQFWTRNATNSTEACGVRLTAGSRPNSTMLEVLNSNIADPDMTLRLGKATIASLLNAATDPMNYPLTAGRIIEMFNAVRAGGSYFVTGANISLTKEGVIQYFEKLYTA